MLQKDSTVTRNEYMRRVLSNYIHVYCLKNYES